MDNGKPKSKTNSLTEICVCYTKVSFPHSNEMLKGRAKSKPQVLHLLVVN